VQVRGSGIDMHDARARVSIRPPSRCILRTAWVRVGAYAQSSMVNGGALDLCSLVEPSTVLKEAYLDMKRSEIALILHCQAMPIVATGGASSPRGNGRRHRHAAPGTAGRNSRMVSCTTVAGLRNLRAALLSEPLVRLVTRYLGYLRALSELSEIYGGPGK
jgi:hypothetical protein